MPHISLAAETLWSLSGFPITNALLTTWLVVLILIVFSFIATRRMSIIPHPVQSIAEMIVGGFYDFFSAILDKHTKTVFPLIMSLFIYIIVANWVGLLPGVGTIGLFHTSSQDTAHTITNDTPIQGEEVQVSDENSNPETITHDTALSVPETETGHDTSSADKSALVAQESHKPAFTPLFRGATADINTTLALAIVAVTAIQLFGFRTVGFHYSNRFINLTNPINFFVGILEIVSELSKVISFAFRLFGNIFAGEVLLTVIAFLMPFFVPLPFLMLELFVGFIQALVFSMLTSVFLRVAIAHGEEH